ncbi:MAG: shikimate kinase [Rhodospirillaceae bacterium]|nr:shikimate kinase [Rhodospirillaceae bacterium]
MDNKPPSNPPSNGADERTIVLVGLMGAGKSSIGRRLAKHLGIRFIDADDEIEKAAGLSIDDIFEIYGEDEFRSGERRVILRILDEGPCVLATGGGAFMDTNVRDIIKKNAVSVWLKVDLDTLLERTSRRGGRPLLKTGDPAKVLGKLMDERYPVYATADITIESGNDTLDKMVSKIANALEGQKN